MDDFDKVRILMLGDKGVGKTCLAHLIAHNKSLKYPRKTVGCNMECKLHVYKQGTPGEKQFWMELLDVGGSMDYKIGRNLFYKHVDGLILVHEVPNRKSHNNLRDWVCEWLTENGKNIPKPRSTWNFNFWSVPSCTFDPELFIDAIDIPFIVIGTNADLLASGVHAWEMQKGDVAAAKACRVVEFWVNCHCPSHLANGSINSNKLSKFFDRVIEKNMDASSHGSN